MFKVVEYFNLYKFKSIVNPYIFLVLTKIKNQLIKSYKFSTTARAVALSQNKFLCFYTKDVEVCAHPWETGRLEHETAKRVRSLNEGSGSSVKTESETGE